MFLPSLYGFNNSSKLLLKNSLAASDSINLGKAYRSRAFYYKNSGKIDSSFIYFSKAEKLYLKLDNEEVNISNVYLNKGVIQYLASDFLGAELSLTRAYRIYKDSENKNNLYIYESYNNYFPYKMEIPGIEFWEGEKWVSNNIYK